MAARPTLLTPEEAAVIARCSLKTVRRAYKSGLLTAYRRRGSRAVLLDNDDVVAWAQGETVNPTRPNQPVESERSRVPARRAADQRAGAGRATKLGTPARVDLSVGALERRRTDASARRGR
jgi:excisionase family DNA binding protein